MIHGAWTVRERERRAPEGLRSRRPAGFEELREYVKEHEDLLAQRDDFGWATLTTWTRKDHEVMALAEESARSGLGALVVFLVRSGIVTTAALDRIEEYGFTNESASPPNY